ncbi:MAG: alpha/beta hydrolase [Candidatus Helarchaeota archaeon]
MVGKYLKFESGENELEGVLFEPGDKNNIISIVLHPHPQYGGSMNNNVVDGVCNVLSKNGLGAFKFNCSGVGNSGGRLEGFERAFLDVKNAVKFLKKDYENIGFIGYSWGSYAGLKALIDDNILKFLGGISPPVSLWDYSFLTKESSKQPKVFVIGENDFFCDKNRFIQLFNQIKVEKKAYKILPTDHFYVGYEEEAGKFILEFITQNILK